MIIEAMKQALEALEELNKVSIGVDAVCLPGEIDTAMDALRTAIAEAEKQEPFGYFQYSMHMDAWVQNRDSNKGVAFYTTPQPQREWVGLTDEETDHLFNMYERSSFGLVRAVEAKLKEKYGYAEEKNNDS